MAGSLAQPDIHEHQQQWSSAGGAETADACDAAPGLLHSTAATGGPTKLLDLPDHLLLDVLAYVDRLGLCSAARACMRLCQLADHPTLWPQHTDDGPVLRRVRAALASALRIPQQAFSCSLDLKRSRRFPVCAPTFPLRPVLRVVDPEGLAAAIAQSLQERVQRANARLWAAGPPRAWPPTATVAVVRSDRACVRMGLNPAAAVAAVVDEIRRMGWPPGREASGAAEEGGGLCSSPEGCLDSGRELALALLEAQQQRLHQAQRLLRSRGLLAFAPPLPDRGPSPVEPRDRLAAARSPVKTPSGADWDRVPLEEEARQAAEAWLEAHRGGVISGSPCCHGRAGESGGGEAFAVRSEVLGAAARRLACCAVLRGGAGGGLRSGGHSMGVQLSEGLAIAGTWLVLRRHLAGVAAAAADALHASPPSPSAQQETHFEQGVPPDSLSEGFCSLPGLTAAMDAAWVAAAASPDLLFCLSALHDLPSILARCCRTGAWQGALTALQAVASAWEERAAAAGGAAGPGGGPGTPLWEPCCGGAGCSVLGSGGGAGVGSPRCAGGDMSIEAEGRMLAMALRAAAAPFSEGAADGVMSAAEAGARRAGHAAVARFALATEALRAMEWCMWLLAVV